MRCRLGFRRTVRYGIMRLMSHSRPGVVLVSWLDPEDLPKGADRVLHPEERLRVHAGPDSRGAQRRIAANVLLRCAVAFLGGFEPRDVPVRRLCPHCAAPHGRPELPGSSMRVSVSHAGNRVAVAVSTRGHVGIDVEAPKPRPLSGALIRRALTAAEQEYLLSCPEGLRRSTFLRAWTAKEAILKATGAGLHGGVRRLELDLRRTPARLRSWAGSTARASTVRLVERDPGDDHVLTLATIDAGAIPVMYRDGRALVARMTG